MFSVPKSVCRAFLRQVALSMLDSFNHSEAVGHLELATGKDSTGVVTCETQILLCGAIASRLGVFYIVHPYCRLGSAVGVNS